MFFVFDRRRALRSLEIAGIALALFAAPALAQGDVGGGGSSAAGGGTYRGPGDTVPGTRGTATGAVPRPIGTPGTPSLPGAPPRPRVVRPVVPPPGMPGSPFDAPPREAPGARPVVEDETSWQLWWHYNRWAHLDVEESVAKLEARTGTGAFFLGRGQTVEETPRLRASRTLVQELVQPRLAEAVEKSDSPALRMHAVLALAKLRGLELPPGRTSFDKLTPRLLRSGNQTVSERAVLALGVRGDLRYLRWLESILADEPDGQARLGGSSVGDRVRAFAAYGLGLLGERSEDPRIRARVHAALSRALREGRDDVQAACLIAMGHVPLPWADVAPGADEALLSGARNRGDQIGEVLAFFQDLDHATLARAQAPVALGRLADGAPADVRSAIVLALLEAVALHADEPREVQNGAVLALGRLGRSGSLDVDPAIRSELERVAFRSSQHRSTRYLAILALARTASRPGAGEEPYAGMEPTRKLLVRQLSRQRGHALAWTALALGFLERDAAARGVVPSPEATDGLRKLFERNRSTEVVGAAAISLGLLRDLEAIEPLLERMLESGESNLRGYCALALGMIGAHEAKEALREALPEAAHQPFALEQIAIALALLGDQGTSARLFTMLQEASDPEVQSSIASALGWLRDPRPLLPLAERLGDDTLPEGTRAWTAVALGRICDADAWPWVGRWSVGVNYDVALATLVEPEFQTGLLDLP